MNQTNAIATYCSRFNISLYSAMPLQVIQQDTNQNQIQLNSMAILLSVKPAIVI